MSETDAKKRPRPRIESLSDMVFGLALSIGAIALLGNPPTTDTGLYNDIAIFGFNFLIIISVWMRYSNIMSVLPLEDRRTLFLNTTLLFLVSLEPFLFNVLRQQSLASNYEFASVATNVYAADLGAIMLIQGFFTLVLADEEKKLIPKDLIKDFKIQSITMFAAGALFIASIAVPLNLLGIGFPVKIDLWFAPLFISWIRRGAVRGIQRARKNM